MHASSIINYHHNHHHQHYYAHQVAAEESEDAGGLGFNQGRSLVTPHQAIESDDNEENGPEIGSAAPSHLVGTTSSLHVGAQPSRDNLPQLTHLGTCSAASHKVHLVGPYEGHEDSHEHYRYNNNSNSNNIIISNDNNNTATYQLASETHYYEQAPPNPAACHHQAVDLSAEQQQQQHGQFETPSAIYYDLSAAEHTSSSQVAAGLTPLNYQHHLDLDLQQRQALLVDPHRGESSFATYSHYETSSNELRYSGEFVSVLAEQNRAARPLEWQDSQQVVVADQASSSADGCHHLQAYAYEFAPILRPAPDEAAHLERNSSSVTYANAFSLAPTGGSSGPYGQQIDTINTSSNFHPANNENSHQHPNDCHLFHDKQAHTHFNRQTLDYETHPLASSLVGHHYHNSRHQAPAEVNHEQQQQRDLAPSRPLSSASESLSMITNSDMESVDSALTRDEKKAREANIPLSYHEIVNLSIDQFNEQLSRFPYTEAQLTLMKDIRRRGKNKVAAQTCRKRKMEQITELQQEVAELANKRILLALERSRLVQEHAKLTEEYESWRTTC